MELTKQTTEYGVAEDRSWLGSAHGTDACQTYTLDVSTLTAGTHFPNGGGLLKSGTALGKITSSGLVGPYSNGANEVQTITISASGGTFTVTVDGETTSAVAWNAAGGTLEDALEALSNVEPGDIVVTGGIGGTNPYILTFGGKWAGADRPAVTTGAGSLTGGGGTAAVATGTAGGTVTDGRQVFLGYLFDSKVITSTSGPDQGVPVLLHGIINEARLPANHGTDDAAKADAAGRFIYR